MRVDHLWLTNFRIYPAAELELGPGLTLVVGGNGGGKTSLLEGIGYLATLGSFRGVPNEALVRVGCDAAIVRAEGSREGRKLLLEAEVVGGSRRGRVSVNHQPLRRTRDLLGALRVTVFSPDDLELVKGGPAGRRRWLDDVLVALHPRNDALRTDLERILRQRNALLRQAGGRLAADVAVTLDVWDERLAEVGEAVAAARVGLLARLVPVVAAAYRSFVSGGAAGVELAYQSEWIDREGGLATALAACRADEIRRGVSLVGPHRDDVAFSVGGMPARTHASQGEQRTLALALRLGAHQVVTEEVGEPPVLLLDDVFSELDGARSRALVAQLPPGQAVLTTAGVAPEGIRAERVLRIADGRVEAASPG